MRKHTPVWAGLAGLTLALTSCGSDDPMGGGGDDDAGQDGALVVGSQQYYSNTVVAELYAQVLEEAGYEVERDYDIGQREAYMPDLEAGEIDVFPEYTGNLLQYLDEDAEETGEQEVLEALGEALPEGLTALTPAEAADQDSYTVTSEFAEEHGLESIGDLAEVEEDLTIVANAEFEERPYGPGGASEVYGATVNLMNVEDSGGQLTLNSLLDGDAQVANIYTADPAIEEHDLVVLEDPEEMILPQNMFPLVSSAVDEEAQAALEEVSAALTQEELIALNTSSVDEQASAEDVAETWLVQHELIQPDGSGQEG